MGKILKIIFDKFVGGTFSEGLVDVESESQFYEKLEEFKQMIADRATESRIAFWLFQYKVDKIVSGMLKPVREEARLGRPPSSFTTNACELINAVLPAFIDHVKQLVGEQDREVKRAVIGRCEYQLMETYKCLELNKADWFRMIQEQRTKHMP